MRYTPQKLTATKKLGSDHSSLDMDNIIPRWLDMTHCPDDIVTHLATPIQDIIDRKKLSAYHMQDMMRKASLLPHCKHDTDPCERLHLVLSDKEMYDVATLLSDDRSNTSLSFDDANEYVSEAERIMSITSCSPSKHLPVLSYVTIIGADAVEQYLSERDADIHDVFDHFSEKSCSPWSSPGLYPSVSKDRQVTSKNFPQYKSSSYPSHGVHNQDKNNWDTGKDTSILMSDQYLDADDAATEMLMQGVDIESVLEFHNDVPDGYWKEVSDYIEQTGMDIGDVYDILEQEFSFHPDERTSTTSPF